MMLSSLNFTVHTEFFNILKQFKSKLYHKDVIQLFILDQIMPKNVIIFSAYF